MNLYIDTHLDDIVIILFTENKIIKEEIITSQKNNSTLIMPTIKKVLGEDIPESILVCNGPGSFTGVRLGVTIAKTLAFTLNIPIRTITYLECMALSADNSIVAFNDKNGYYIGQFNDNLELIGDYKYLSNNEYIGYSHNHHVVTDVTLNYLKIFTYAMTKNKLNPHEVNPIYIKKLAVEK